jgi:glutamate receptor, ionotropic, invertebrate
MLIIINFEFLLLLLRIYIVCQLLQEGVAVIIGPQSPPSASHVQSVCDAVHVPHIETSWDFRSMKGGYLLNLFPHPAVLTRVCF